MRKHDNLKFIVNYAMVVNPHSLQLSPVWSPNSEYYRQFYLNELRTPSLNKTSKAFYCLLIG